MHACPEDIERYKGRYNAGYEAIRKARFDRMRKMGLIPDEWELIPPSQRWGDVPEERRAWELRDIGADRSEMHELSAKHPETAKEPADLREKEAHRTLIFPRPVGK